MSFKKIWIIFFCFIYSCGGDGDDGFENQKLSALTPSQSEEFCESVEGPFEDLPKTIQCPKRGPLDTDALLFCNEDRKLFKGFKDCEIKVLQTCLNTLSNALHESICADIRLSKVEECSAMIACESRN